MTRYHVADAGTLETVRQAINAGWRATPGAQSAQAMVGGVIVGQEPLAAYEARMGLPPMEIVHASRLIVAGAEAALELPDGGRVGERVTAQLGKTVNGVAIPSNGFAQVTRPREHSRLPPGVRDQLDDRYVDGEHAQIGSGHANEAAYRAAVIAELQGARATAALARKDARGSQAALEAAMGIGRSR